MAEKASLAFRICALLRGFALVRPAGLVGLGAATRIGYGVTGGPDPEDTGSCERKNYPPGYVVSAEQTRQVIEHARKRPDIDGSKIVVAGQSYGGTTAITVAAMNLPGVVAGINFAGGGGGRPDTHPGEPCPPSSSSACSLFPATREARSGIS